VLIPLTTPEVRRLLLALAEPPERFSFRLAWSHWRRRHQATAKQGQVARPPARSPDRTDDQWQRLLPLLPPQQPGRGRPRGDQRRVVAALLWRTRTGCSWRSIPSHFGPWHTLHYRYHSWRDSGLWDQILALLDLPETQQSAA